MKKSLSAQLAHDGNGGRGANTAGTGLKHGAYVGEGADSAGGFDAGAGTCDAAQESDIGGGCAGGGKAGGGLEKVSAGLDGDLSATKFFFDGEEAGFKDDLEDCAVVVGDVGGGVDGAVDGGVLAGFEKADGDDHV